MTTHTHTHTHIDLLLVNFDHPVNNGYVPVSNLENDYFSSPNRLVKVSEEQQVTPEEGWLHASTGDAWEQDIIT